MSLTVSHTNDLPAVISPSQPTSLAFFLCIAQACKHVSSLSNVSTINGNKQIAQRQYTTSWYLREKLAQRIGAHHDAVSRPAHLYVSEGSPLLHMPTCKKSARSQPAPVD